MSRVYTCESRERMSLVGPPKKRHAVVEEEGDGCECTDDDAWMENSIDGNCLFESFAQMFHPYCARDEEQVDAFRHEVVPLARYFRWKVCEREKEMVTAGDVFLEDMHRQLMSPEATDAVTQALRRTRAPRTLGLWPKYMAKNRMFATSLEIYAFTSGLLQGADVPDIHTVVHNKGFALPPNERGHFTLCMLEQPYAHYRLLKYDLDDALRLGDYPAFGDYAAEDWRF